MSDLLGSLFILLGSLLTFIGNLGVLRFPNTLMRAHALSKALTLGVILMLIGMWISLQDQLEGLKVLLAITFQLSTIPLAAHLLGFMAFWKDKSHRIQQEDDVSYVTEKKYSSLSTRKISIRKPRKS